MPSVESCASGARAQRRREIDVSRAAAQRGTASGRRRARRRSFTSGSRWTDASITNAGTIWKPQAAPSAAARSAGLRWIISSLLSGGSIPIAARSLCTVASSSVAIDPPAKGRRNNSRYERSWSTSSSVPAELLDQTDPVDNRCWGNGPQGPTQPGARGDDQLPSTVRTLPRIATRVSR